jgi:hypothetical protein
MAVGARLTGAARNRLRRPARQKIIVEDTEWRFLNERKRKLKA